MGGSCSNGVAKIQTFQPLKVDTRNFQRKQNEEKKISDKTFFILIYYNAQNLRTDQK